MIEMIHDDEKRVIRDALRLSRREGLGFFVEEFVTVLAQEGFSLEDLLHGIASWLYRTEGSVKVIRHLEDAATELSCIQDEDKQ
ncbi:hypothetical protein NIES25_70010 (plasmid) [Nostoc linckia NIES-25]|nr:hypothetical protein NIES25_70010 [Nostoc linckia NIES-25]